jgi:hypothetical protein
VRTPTFALGISQNGARDVNKGIDREDVLKSRSDFDVIEQGSQRGHQTAVPAQVIVQALDVESSKVIDLDKFVPRNDIDPVYFDTPYYVYPDGPIAVETLRVIGAAMAEAGVVGLGRLTLSRRERMVMVEPAGPEWRCSRSELLPKLGHHNLAAPTATSMPRWWQLPVRSSDSGLAHSIPPLTETAIRKRCAS